MQKLNSLKCQPSFRRRTPQQVASPLRVEGRWVERLSCDGLSDSGKAKRKKDARDLVKGAVTALSHPNPIANSDSFQAYFGRAKAIFDFKTATWRFREQQRSACKEKTTVLQVMVGRVIVTGLQLTSWLVLLHQVSQTLLSSTSLGENVRAYVQRLTLSPFLEVFAKPFSTK